MRLLQKWLASGSICLPFFCFAGLPLPVFSQNSADASLFSTEGWKSSQPPFSFKYDGKKSSTFLSNWNKSQDTLSSEGGQLDRETFTDPATGLKVTVEWRTFKDYDAAEWMLKFSNEGNTDTPIIEDIEPLSASLLVSASAQVVLHSARGSQAAQNDFEPQTQTLEVGQSIKLSSNGGRPSQLTLPFFDLQVDQEGIIGAIGWTGYWNADFIRPPEGTTIALDAGMKKTHLLLHPGEEIRTPRILLLNWKGGDRDKAHNIWRRLLLAYYSPQEKGRPVVGPACLATWGDFPISERLPQVETIVRKKIPLDAYWIDAGWYGNEGYHVGVTPATTPWHKNRGNWWPDSECYPDGFKPLSDLLHQNGIAFLLWFEPEQAEVGSDLMTRHPEWFLKRRDGGGLLNLGNPEARKGITKIVSDMIDKAGVDWYRQDFNYDPGICWVDGPDRMGMTEIQYVEGLYAFWDDLRASHPDLKIDDCSSGGRRLDLETISRSMALWRSDYSCGKTDATGPQLQTLGLAPWVPLSAGTFEHPDAYSLRSAYGAGVVVDACNRIVHMDDAWFDWVKNGLTEFQRVRPFFYGDFYSLLPYDSRPDAWTSIQLDRPDLNAGVGIFLRRPDSMSTTINVHFQNIDSAASYSVETCAELGPGTIKTMLGEELINLPVTISTNPGSVLIFYKKS